MQSFTHFRYSTRSQLQVSFNWLKQIGMTLMAPFSPTSPFVIRQRQTPSGPKWVIQDLEFNRTCICFSEDEVRIWIENRYYQS